jgi:HicB-like protein involved in pilus formation
MDVTPYVTALREDLMSAASAGDENTQRTAALLGAAIEPAARLAVMTALSDLAREVTEALGDERTVEVRLDGREVRVVVSTPPGPPPPEQPPAPPPPPTTGDAGDISRITLRLMEEIKGRAERAANQQGVSLNAWISQAVQGALRGDHPWDRGGQSWGDWAQGRDRRRDRDRGRDDDNRLRGWVQG